MVGLLEATGNYRVLRRLEPRARYASPRPGAPLRRGLIVDVETTGLDTANDRIIELGLVAFEYDDSGQVYGVDPQREWFEDPGVPIPAEAVEITGITDEMVRGQHIDRAAVEAEIARANLIIAHNAGFDRPVLERYFQSLRETHWACSLRDVPWSRFGCRGGKLDYLLLQLCHAFHTGHRAGDDCLATLHVLASPRDGDITPLSLLRQQALRKTVRLSAIGSPIGSKDLLKARGYRWFNGSIASQKAKTWYKDIYAEDVKAEQQWLRDHVYRGISEPQWQLEEFTAKERYSERASEMAAGAVSQPTPASTAVAD